LITLQPRRYVAPSEICDNLRNLWINLEMAEHTGFQKLVAEAKKHITEISPQDAATKLNSGDAVIVDVRDKDEWDEGHIPGATHMSRGTIELDIEEKVPDPNAMIICHCGGGGRSALAAEALQKMGYKNVRSMAGGLKAWKAGGLPTTM
jgi:phage shock protein E